MVQKNFTLYSTFPVLYVLPLTELMLGADSFATLTRPPSKLACLEAALGAAVRTCWMSQLPNLLTVQT